MGFRSGARGENSRAAHCRPDRERQVRRRARARASASARTIVNADSMQVYRDLRVLTARPDAAESELAPHRLFGEVDGAVNFSVGRWLRGGDVAPRARRRAGR